MRPLIAAVLLLTVTTNVFGWTFRPAFNKPQSKIISPTPASPIGIYFREPGYPSGNFNSRVMSGLANKGYTHIAVINRTRYPLSFVTYADGGSAPDKDIEEKLFVPSSGAGTFDDISIFNYLYLMAEDGNSIPEGKVEISVW